MSGVSQNLSIAIYYISALSGMKMMNSIGWIGIAMDSLRDDDSWFSGEGSIKTGHCFDLNVWDISDTINQMWGEWDNDKGIYGRG